MEAPFYVGQRVVCVDDGNNRQGLTTVGENGLKKGEIYIVKSVVMACCYFLVDVGFRKMCFQICRVCCKLLPSDGRVLFMASRFAPITPREVEIDAAIIEQAEEMVSVKETVLEPVLN